MGRSIFCRHAHERTATTQVRRVGTPAEMALLSPGAGLVMLVLAIGGLACNDTVEERVVFVDRSGCEACHRPLMEDGTPVGIEKAHPDVDGEPLSCTDCHGGDAESRKQSEAHATPGTGGVRFVRNATQGELDDVDADYLRFVNPGDLRVAPMSCGAGSPRAAGSGCHQDVIDTLALNPMTTLAGDLGVGRYRAGLQRGALGLKAVADVRDPDYVRGEVPGTVGSLEKLEEPAIPATTFEIGPYQDLYFTKECMRCHLGTFGDNAFVGEYRSSGCTACHMVYADDGLSQSNDPLVDKDNPPHPIEHRLTTAIPTSQCTHCHNEGARIGPSFQGYRERAGDGLEADGVETLGRALYGHDANFFIADEDTSNDRDETPADVHFSAGMHCIDCHTEAEVHGDGRLYGDGSSLVEIRCESCHGTIDEVSDLTTARGRPLPQLSRDDDGAVWLTSKVTGERHPVTQVRESLDRADSSSAMHRAMARIDGFSHTDEIECYTCHSGWMPNCYGCHVTMNMSEVQRSYVNGRTTPGAVSEATGRVSTDVLILLRNRRGRIAPSMPSEKMFFTAIDGEGSTIIDRAVREGPNGEPGMGQRAIHPHTIVKASPFGECARCHPADAAFSNMDTVMQTVGYGSDRFVETDGEGTPWPLDRTVDPETDTSTVLPGHDEPEESRPLSPGTIERMLNVMP